MSINFEENYFDGKHIKLSEEDVYPLVHKIKPIQAVYILPENIGVDATLKAWIGPDATAFPAEKALAMAEEETICRLIILPRGRWIDLSNSGMERLEIDSQTKFKDEGWLSVTGLIKTTEERVKAEEMIRRKYNVSVGSSVIGLASTEELDEVLDDSDD
jgi:hypothetical protein